jgi:hypothetical protein
VHNSFNWKQDVEEVLNALKVVAMPAEERRRYWEQKRLEAEKTWKEFIKEWIQEGKEIEEKLRREGKDIEALFEKDK